MIRINLLPPEERAKKREFRLPEMSTVYLVAGVVVFFAAILVIGFMQHHQVRVLEGKIETAKEESRKLAPQLAKIKQITREREEVDRRLNLITSLDRHRYFRVKLLNDISMKTPENCWLTDIQELSPNRYSIDGVTFSNYTVADMISNLETSGLFTQVDLTIAEMGQIKDRQVMKFTLSANALPQ
ncbi:MAG: PilN domain-containing protein [Candidatus Krumholzibacteriota bacterium]|nr:PilN domain-containing protein [Candidatus Krumholzibacteriota bacterium]